MIISWLVIASFLPLQVSIWGKSMYFFWNLQCHFHVICSLGTKKALPRGGRAEGGRRIIVFLTHVSIETTCRQRPVVLVLAAGNDVWM